MRRALCTLLLSAVSAASAPSPVQAHHTESKPLAVSDAIETTRFYDDKVYVSPERDRYVAILVRGDIRRDGLIVEPIGGRLDSLAATRPHTLDKLFTRGLGGAPMSMDRDESMLTVPHWNDPQWIDDHRIAILWPDNRGIRQVISIDLDGHGREYLTHSPRDVTRFSVEGGGTLIASVRIHYSPDKFMERVEHGFAVQAPDAFSLIGQLPPGASLGGYTTEYFMTTAQHPEMRKIDLGQGGANHGSLWSTPSPAPNGKTVIVSGTPEALPKSWANIIEPNFRDSWNAALAGGRGSAVNRTITQLFVVDVETAKGRPLWGAPEPWSTASRIMLWSPDSSHVLLGPTFLPPLNSDRAGLEGRAVAVVDVSSGHFSTLPVPQGIASELAKANWFSSDSIHLELADGREIRFERHHQNWILTPSPAPVPISGTPDTKPRGPQVVVELRQDLNTPPALYATDKLSGHVLQILDPNPRLKIDHGLGRVEQIRWRDQAGREWTGNLFYPAHYTTGRRYPLVIQTNGYGIGNRFSLYGPSYSSLGPAISASGLGQLLATREIAVLQVADYPRNDAELRALNQNSLAFGQQYVAAYYAAAQYLVERGIADRNLIGIAGFSNRGWHVELAVSLSEFPYAAAIADDNLSGGYMQAALAGWDYLLAQSVNGDKPFGTGFKSWLENSPAFNAERVRAPVLFIECSAGTIGIPGLLLPWESFSRLRYLKKPVEYYVMPNILRATHSTQNPTQVLGIEERALDWWLFWLTGEEDPVSQKAAQYAEWHQLRTLHQIDVRTPRPPRLQWSALPKPRVAH